ncbi:hypothetical protein KAX97_14690 [candidate division WOR-3 bacterium]|nr:hypothetical protein [candidate division WOR-3 bacterium]
MKRFENGDTEIQSRSRVRCLLRIDWKMIADAKGVSKRTVQRAYQAGKIDILDLKSVVAEYITR